LVTAKLVKAQKFREILTVFVRLLFVLVPDSVAEIGVDDNRIGLAARPRLCERGADFVRGTGVLREM
jgi:hypothetical protein